MADTNIICLGQTYGDQKTVFMALPLVGQGTAITPRCCYTHQETRGHGAPKLFKMRSEEIGFERLLHSYSPMTHLTSWGKTQN